MFMLGWVCGTVTAIALYLCVDYLIDRYLNPR